MRNRLFSGIAALAALLVAPIAAGAAGGDKAVTAGEFHYIVPAASPVQYASVNADGGALFAGRFVLTGTFTYSVYPNANDVEQFAFTPDRDIAVRLPHEKGQPAPSIITFELAISDVPRLIAAIVPAAMRAEVKAHRTKQVAGRVSLDVDHYTAMVEGCTGGLGDFDVHFISVHTPGTARVEPLPPEKPAPEGSEGQDC